MMKYLKSRYTISIFCILAICIVLGAWATGAITSALAAHTAPKPAPAIKLATLRGDIYTIGIPAGWSVKKASVTSITFLTTSPRRHNTTTLLVETVTSKGAVSSKGAVQGGLTGAKKSAKSFRIKNVPATVIINGVRWDEGAATISDGHTSFVIVIIAARHPRNAHKLVAIIRIAKVSDFNSVDAREFKQILRSFRFV